MLVTAHTARSERQARLRRYIDGLIRKRGPPQKWGSKSAAAAAQHNGRAQPAASAPAGHGGGLHAHGLPLVHGTVAAIAASAAHGAAQESDDESQRDDGYWSGEEDGGR